MKRSGIVVSGPIYPVVATLALAGAGWGCASLFQTTTSSSSSSDQGYEGPLTFVNQSSAQICALEWSRGEDGRWDGTLGTGQSVEIAAGADWINLVATECGGQNTVFGTRGSVGDPGPDYIGELQHPRIVLYDTVPADVSGEHAFDVNRLPMSAWIPYGRDWQDVALATQALNETIDHAQRSGWNEHFQFAVLMGREWNIVRNDWTSIIEGRTLGAAVAARWDDGHCTIQEFGFYDEHDGNNFRGVIRFNGVGPQWELPCAAIEYAASMPGVASLGGSSASPSAPASSPTAGRCENTCSTAYDSECDDGGPNSLYSVCALGTDCADCGPR